jgi:hypothetical protein
VGTDVTGKEKVKNIVQIHIALDEYASPSPSSTATATPPPTAAPTKPPTPTAAPTATPTASPSPSTSPTQEYTLLVNGTTAETMTSAQFEAEVSKVSSTFTDSKAA